MPMWIEIRNGTANTSAKYNDKQVKRAIESDGGKDESASTDGIVVTNGGRRFSRIG